MSKGSEEEGDDDRTLNTYSSVFSSGLPEKRLSPSIIPNEKGAGLLAHRKGPMFQQPSKGQDRSQIKPPRNDACEKKGL